jgi:hypothetical protein
MATAIWATSFAMVRQMEAACVIASTLPRYGSSIATTWRPKAMVPIWIR